MNTSTHWEARPRLHLTRVRCRPPAYPQELEVVPYQRPTQFRVGKDRR
jgi:hypothetical protein